MEGGRDSSSGYAGKGASPLGGTATASTAATFPERPGMAHLGVIVAEYDERADIKRPKKTNKSSKPCRLWNAGREIMKS